MDTLNNKGLKTFEEWNHEEMVRQIPVSLYMLVLFITGTTGNTLVCYIFSKKYKISSFRTFVIALSVIDFCTCLIVIPLTFGNDAAIHNSYAWMCKLLALVKGWCSFTSPSILFVITFERYRKVCKPFSWQFSCKTARNVYIVIGLTGLAWGIPRTVIYGINKTEHTFYNFTISECKILDAWLETALPKVKFITTYAIAMLLFVYAFVMYCFIAVRVYQQMKQKQKLVGKLVNGKRNEIAKITSTPKERKERSNNIRNVDNDNNINCRSAKNEKENEEGEQNVRSTKPHLRLKNQRLSSLHRTTLVMFMATIAFVVTFVPTICLVIIRSLDLTFLPSLTGIDKTLYELGMRSWLLNAAINPVIYGIVDPHFRKSCKFLYTCKHE